MARLESRVEAAAVALDRERAESTSEIEAQEARVGLYKSRLARAAELLQKQIVAEERVEELRADVEVGARELARAETQQRLAELELARSRALFDRRTIRTPISGFVSERALSPGEFVDQEDHIVTVARLDPLHVEAFLPVTLWGQITTGMTAIVHPAAPTLWRTKVYRGVACAQRSIGALTWQAPA